MSDLIDRKMAIDEICRVCLVCCTETCQGRNPDSKWCDEITALREIPSAKPKKGKWEAIDVYEVVVACSECKHKFTYQHNFCPNCGAKMEETE